ALALDLNQAAHEIIRVLLLLLPPLRPRLDVIHAFDLPYNSLVYPSLSGIDALERQSELRTHATVKLRKLLATALANANIRPEHAPLWNTYVRHGSPYGVVRKIVDRSDTDLLVLGTQGFSGAAYVFLGSISGELLRDAKCDVLVVPPTPARA
ncbi:MAG TPA: universal stress protein, partial [Polyangiales bacterium]|nr:universal stress protein [Polyangiales bacterium]